MRLQTLTLANSSVSELTVETTYPMATGKVAVTADGVTAGTGKLAVIDLDADSELVTVSAAYVWHTELGSATYDVKIVRPAPSSGE